MKGIWPILVIQRRSYCVCHGADIPHRNHSAPFAVVKNFRRTVRAICRYYGDVKGHGLARTVGKPSQAEDKTKTPAARMMAN